MEIFDIPVFPTLISLLVLYLWAIAATMEIIVLLFAGMAILGLSVDTRPKAGRISARPLD